MTSNKENSKQNPTHTNLLTKPKPHPKPKQTQIESIGKDCFSDSAVASEESYLKDLMTGERTHLSFDLPLKLHKAFKWATRHNKQTMCPVLQDFIMVYVGTTRFKKACFNNTSASTISIENLVIPSYERLKFRRHFEAEDDNFYDGSLGSWLHVDGELNGNGHVIGCQCSRCRGKQSVDYVKQ